MKVRRNPTFAHNIYAGKTSSIVWEYNLFTTKQYPGDMRFYCNPNRKTFENDAPSRYYLRIDNCSVILPKQVE